MYLDIETTGLDPHSDLILEMGMVLTDSKLNVLATWGETVNWPDIEYNIYEQTYEPPFGVHDAVVKMHTRNGLWQDSYRSNKTIEDVIASAAFWAGQQLFDADDKVPLCGNTIGFDKSFLYEADPKFLDLFHYRSVDVSSHKLCYIDWVLDSPEDRPVEPIPEGNKLHRAVPDCLDSINEMAFFKRKLYGG
jgi:oligoribonuclease